MLLKSLELYSSVELLEDDRYEPPIVLGSRDCNGARLLEDTSPDNFELRCAVLIAVVVFLVVVAVDAGPGTRTSVSV